MPVQSVSAPTLKHPGNAGVLVFATLVLCAAFGEVATFVLGARCRHLANSMTRRRARFN
jgi:hypothetical protein